MKPAIVNEVCRFRGLCASCQSDPNWRRQAGTPSPCGDSRGPFPGLGDKIESLVKPIAKAIGSPCLDSNSSLKPSSPCAKIRDTINRLTK